MTNKLTVRELLQYCMAHYVPLDTVIKLDNEDVGFVGYDPQSNSLVLDTDTPKDWCE